MCVPDKHVNTHTRTHTVPTENVEPLLQGLALTEGPLRVH